MPVNPVGLHIDKAHGKVRVGRGGILAAYQKVSAGDKGHIGVGVGRCLEFSRIPASQICLEDPFLHFQKDIEIHAGKFAFSAQHRI